MFEPGLVSISFRKWSVEEVIAQCLKNGLSCIEWGGDVHVPAGDDDTARRVAALMAEHRLRTAAYGSYYRCAVSDPADFDRCLRSAELLGAPTIRVWAGNTASADAGDAVRGAVVADLKRICRLAAGRGIAVNTEYHAKTLTDTTDSALALFAAVDDPNLRTGWQPPNGKSRDYRVDGLKRVLPLVTTVHAFHWIEQITRRPLAEGLDDWRAYLKELAGGDHAVLLEFVMDDSAAQLRDDAAALRRLLAEF